MIPYSMEISHSARRMIALKVNLPQAYLHLQLENELPLKQDLLFGEIISISFYYYHYLVDLINRKLIDTRATYAVNVGFSGSGFFWAKLPKLRPPD